MGAWTRQPPPGTPIDWGNPLTEGLIFAFPGNGTVELVSGASSTTTGLVTAAVSADGIGNSNFSSANYLNWPNAIPPAFGTNANSPYSFFGIAATDLSAPANISRACTAPSPTWSGATIIGAGSTHNPSDQLAITYGNQYDYAFPGTFFETAGTPYRILIAQTGNAANAWRNHRFFGSMSAVGTCTGLYYGIGIGNGFVTAGFIGPVFWWDKDVTATGDVIAANPWQLFWKRRRFYSFASGAGTLITASLLDALTAADTLGAKLAAVSTLTDAGAASDGVSALAQYLAAMSAAASAADSPAASATYPVSLSSAGSAADSLAAAAAFQAAVSASATAADAWSALGQFVASLTASTTAADAATTGQIIVVALSDAAAAADALIAAATFTATLSASATAADSGAALAFYAAALSDAATASDIQAAIAAYVAECLDQGAASDAILGGLHAIAAIIESGTATDAMTATAFSGAPPEAACKLLGILVNQSSVSVTTRKSTLTVNTQLSTSKGLQ